MPRCEILLSYCCHIQNTFYTFSKCRMMDTATMKLHEGNRKVYKFGKTDDVVALHAYQSFREGEVTPEQCHEIGVALARKVWGKEPSSASKEHANPTT